MQNAITEECNARNEMDVHRYGPVCGDRATKTIMQDGPRHVCWAHANAHAAGLPLTFHTEEPAAAASNA